MAKQTTAGNILYSYCACPHCVGFYVIYSPFAASCKKCGAALRQCDFPHDPTDENYKRQNKEFMDSWWAKQGNR